MMPQLKRVRQGVVQRWTDPERCFRWIGSRDMGSIFGVKRHACPRSGRWHLRMWTGVG